MLKINYGLIFVILVKIKVNFGYLSYEKTNKVDFNKKGMLKME